MDTSYAEEAGIKSATFEIDAPYAFGTLCVEAGTHRLVRMSPFGAAGKRQTSFAAVEVIPLMEEAQEIEIPENDIRVDVFRSSGPGGQSVNTTDSAVRLTHLPTGIVVSMQNEKSQIQNRAAAMRVLQSRLLLLQKEQEAAQKKELAGNITASWGDQMRSLRARAVPDGEGPAHRLRGGQPRRRCSTATSTGSSPPASSGARATRTRFRYGAGRLLNPRGFRYGAGRLLNQRGFDTALSLGAQGVSASPRIV